MTTPEHERYFDLSAQLGRYPPGNATLLIARSNAGYNQYSRGLITPAEFQRIIDKITTEISTMSFRIQVTPVYIATPEDQFLVDTPHFVGYSADPSSKDLDPMHSRVTNVESEAIVFDSVDKAESFAQVLRYNKAHKYDVVEA